MASTIARTCSCGPRPALLDADLPAADVIALHGVCSWVNGENRAHIVAGRA